MNISDFIKERSIFILLNLAILIGTAILLKALRVDTYAIAFILLINTLGILCFHFYDYVRRKNYYNELMSNLRAIDKKYLISELMEEGDFVESKILYEIIDEANKSMNDEIAKLRINSEEYKEYIELWVHEVKTPIATCKLLVENNSSPITKSIDEEIEKVENYIEQALFYTRSNALEKDYLVKEMNLRDSANAVIRRNANVLIERKVKIEINNLDQVVYSDTKWVEFILHQIISNSIKYMDKEPKILKFYCENSADNVILHIYDNGIGMSERDVIKAFEKGYTGENGRRFGKSTGIGLYLCKKLCYKLGLEIKLESKAGEGTKVSIMFPINRMMIFE